MSRFRMSSSPKFLNSKGFQVRRFSNDISIDSIRLCPSRLEYVHNKRLKI